jgi:hypothetical protein
MVVDAGYKQQQHHGHLRLRFQHGSFTLNGPTVYTTGNFIPFNPGQVSFTTSNPLGTVLGGRHEIGVHLDTNSEVVEISEVSGCLPDNNHAYERYVVTPFTLSQQCAR